MKYIYYGFNEIKYQSKEPKEWVKKHYFSFFTSVLLIISLKFRQRYLYEVYGWYFETNCKNFFFWIAWSRIIQDIKRPFKKKIKPNDDDLPF